MFYETLEIHVICDFFVAKNDKEIISGLILKMSVFGYILFKNNHHKEKLE